MAPRAVAIAGANGMVGRHLVAALLARGDRVIALVRSPGAYPFPSNVEVRPWQAREPVAPLPQVDLPTIGVSGGPQLRGVYRGQIIGSGTNIISMSEQLRAGEITLEEFHFRVLELGHLGLEQLTRLSDGP